MKIICSLLVAMLLLVSCGEKNQDVSADQNAITDSATNVAEAVDTVAEAPQPQDFDTFWKEFKQAFIANDKDKLCAMTNFPLEYGQQHQISDAEYDMEPEKQTKEEFLKQEYTPFGDEYVINSIKDQEATVERKDNYITCSFTTENGSLMLKFELIDGKYKLVYYEHWQFS